MPKRISINLPGESSLSKNKQDLVLVVQINVAAEKNGEPWVGFECFQEVALTGVSVVDCMQEIMEEESQLELSDKIQDAQLYLNFR